MNRIKERPGKLIWLCPPPDDGVCRVDIHAPWIYNMGGRI